MSTIRSILNFNEFYIFIFYNFSLHFKSSIQVSLLAVEKDTENLKKKKKKEVFWNLNLCTFLTGLYYMYSNDFEILCSTIFDYISKHVSVTDVEKNVQKIWKLFLKFDHLWKPPRESYYSLIASKFYIT